jgi:3-hydroxyisobutyrate dehydrogenase-like beta-hydroxyacid dehydrogenase
MTTLNKTAKVVTVIGLGQMGAALAQLLLKSGYHVTVWNRSSDKAKALVQEGAILADSVVAAISASPIIIICVHNYKATDAILNTPEVEAIIGGRSIMQLSTISPQEALKSEAWAQQYGAEYINGAIQAAPAQMGRPDTPILISGSKKVYSELEAVFQIFGGTLSYLGEKAGAAATVDLATLSYIYGASLGFFHGVRIIENEGLDVANFGTIVKDISPTFGEFLKHEADVVHRDDFTVSQSPLSISVEAVQRLLDTAKESGINTDFPVFANKWLKQAAEAGYGNEEAAAIIKVLRNNPY